jgi:hypothetical protein
MTLVCIEFCNFFNNFVLELLPYCNPPVLLGKFPLKYSGILPTSAVGVPQGHRCLVLSLSLVEFHAFSIMCSWKEYLSP